MVKVVLFTLFVFGCVAAPNNHTPCKALKRAHKETLDLFKEVCPYDAKAPCTAYSSIGHAVLTANIIDVRLNIGCSKRGPLSIGEICDDSMLGLMEIPKLPSYVPAAEKELWRKISAIMQKTMDDLLEHYQCADYLNA